MIAHREAIQLQLKLQYPEQLQQIVWIYLIAIVNEEIQILAAPRTGQEVWTLPGGKVVAGEGFLRALIREVREETGIVLAFQDVISLQPLLFDNFSCVPFLAYFGRVSTQPPENLEFTKQGPWLWLKLEEFSRLVVLGKLPKVVSNGNWLSNAQALSDHVVAGLCAGVCVY